jgi:gamma-glutamyltranspeptidase/glutathione hydrolase
MQSYAFVAVYLVPFVCIAAVHAQTQAPRKLAAKSAIGEATCAVATVHPLATDAGVQAFRSGGNALDAAIAAALTLGVVDNQNSGLGGGCFILIRGADGSLAAIDGRETAPAAATRDMFIRNGQAKAALSQTGPLAVGVPGALAAYELALKKYGKRELDDLILPAAKIADDGFAISDYYAGRLRASARQLAKFPGSRQALLKPDGSPYKAGETLRQPELARSHRDASALVDIHGGISSRQASTRLR